MHVVKLKKTDLKMDLEDLLLKLGLVKGDSAYPDCLLMSLDDQKVLKSNIEKKFKKKYPELSRTALQNSVGMYWLNLGPSHRLEKALRPGYAIILDPSERND